VAERESPEAFYDALAPEYDAIFDDWWVAALEHGRIIDSVLQHAGVARGARLLDCACGIGTQALPLAQLGYQVTGTDVSSKAVARARAEAEARSIPAVFMAADMRVVDQTVPGAFGAVIACDNSVPHLLDDTDLDLALAAVRSALVPGGVFLASIRDYDALRAERPTGTPGRVRVRAGGREISGQAWEWSDDGERMRIHLYVMRERDQRWKADVHTTHYRALRRADFTAALERAHFDAIRWWFPEESGYYQPIVTASAW
jgi:SAM-dependent methyltransferase